MLTKRQSLPMRGLVIVALLAVTAPAEARGLARFQFTISPTGKVTKIWSASGVAANTTRPARPTTPTASAASAILEDDVITIRDPDGKELRRVKLARRDQRPSEPGTRLWIAGDRSQGRDHLDHPRLTGYRSTRRWPRIGPPDVPGVACGA